MKLGKQGGSRQAGRLAQRLAAYIPQSLTARILRGETLKPGEARRFNAAALFCDISGFSVMTRELAQDGPRGAEELNRILLMTLTAMISAIHNAGGEVSHFHGDALMVYLPDDDGQAAERALACAQFMQSLMQGGYSEVVANLAGRRQEAFHLSMKVGVGYGRCLEVVVGDPNESLEFIVAGPAIEEAVAAEKRAKSGTVIASRAVLEKAGLPAPADFRLVTEMMPVPYARATLHWDAYEQDSLWQLAETAAAFVPDALHERTMTEQAYFVAEHRPATSMFVRFEGIDYADELAGKKLQTYYQWARRVVSRYGGKNSRVNRVLTGDKGSLLHIIFGAPIAPEAPAEAVRCALALQHEKPDFITGQQIGVVTGNVFACAVGSRQRREYTIVGEVVNLSSRLTDQCPVGGVVTDGLTMQRAQNGVQFKHLKTELLKGISEPVAIYEALGEHRSSTELRARFGQRQRPLPWRALEQDKLLTIMATALSGKTGAVAIYGPTTSEYARLLAAGVSHWLDAGGTAVVGVGQQHTSNVPFGLWINAWRDFFGIQPNMEEGEQADLIVERMKELLPRPLQAEELALWGEMFGLPLPLTGWSEVALKAEQRQKRLLEMTRIYFDRAARRRPLLLVLEEVHWADTLSLELLSDLLQSWSDAPLLVVMTYNSTVRFAAAALPQCEVIPLQPLSAAEGRKMAQTLLDGMALPEGLTQRLGLDDESSSVNPIFLEESVIMMLESGIIKINGKLTLNEEALASMPVPENIHSLLMARFDHLSAASRTLLQAASVIGRQFDLETLMQMLPEMATQAVRPLLSELSSARMIHTIQAGSNPIYLFHDDMIHDVAYRSIPYGRRQRWHTAIANSIIKQHRHNLRPYYPRLAFHFGQTDLHERGLEFAMKAAEDARRVYAIQSALEMYTVAEKHLRNLDDSSGWEMDMRLRLGRAESLRLVGELAAARTDLEKALQLALKHKQAVFVGLAYNALAQIEVMQGRSEEALALVELVLRGFGERRATEPAATAWALKGAAYGACGDFDKAQQPLEKAVQLYLEANDNAGLLRVWSLLGHDIWAALGKWDEAAAALTRAHRAADKLTFANPDDMARLFVGQVQVALHMDQQQAAQLLLDRLGGLVTDKGLVWWQPAAHYLHGRYHQMREDLVRARSLFQQAATAVEDGGDPVYLPLILLALAHLAPTAEQEREYLVKCVAAAQERARPHDRLHCLEAARAMGYIAP